MRKPMVRWLAAALMAIPAFAGPSYIISVPTTLDTTITVPATTVSTTSSYSGFSYASAPVSSYSGSYVSVTSAVPTSNYSSPVTNTIVNTAPVSVYSGNSYLSLYASVWAAASGVPVSSGPSYDYSSVSANSYMPASGVATWTSSFIVAAPGSNVPTYAYQGAPASSPSVRGIPTAADVSNPEPASIFMMVGGLGALVYARRRLKA